MAHIIQTADECQLQCLTIEFSLPPADEYDGIFQ
jgi:hypothetical protein